MANRHVRGRLDCNRSASPTVRMEFFGYVDFPEMVLNRSACKGSHPQRFLHVTQFGSPKSYLKQSSWSRLLKKYPWSLVTVSTRVCSGECMVYSISSGSSRLFDPQIGTHDLKR